MSERVIWYEDLNGHPQRDISYSPDHVPDHGTTIQYRVVGKTHGGKREVSHSTTSLIVAQKKKAFWDKTGYYSLTFIESRIIGEWSVQ